MFLNNKGQAFDVFKLLIAAVIAVVILTLLLAIIGRINIFGNADPQTEAGNIVNELVSKRGVLKPSATEVVFKPSSAISNKGISDSTKGSLGPEQICVSRGEFGPGNAEEEDTRFKGVPGKSVIYQGSSSQNASIVGICDTGSEMAQDLGRYLQDYANNEIKAEWEGVGDCPCITPEFTRRCCVVALKRYRG